MRRRVAGAALALTLMALAGPAPTAAQDHRVSFTGYLGGAGYTNLAGQLDPGVLLESSSFYGGMAELWFGRLGMRLHAGFGSPSVQDVPGTGFDLVAGDLDLVARFRRPRQGLFFQPYGVVGLGAIRYDLGSDATDVAGFSYPENPTTRGTLVLGVGTDLGSGPVAVRLEMMDLVGFSSPLAQSDGSSFDPVGHVIFTFGLSIRAGTIALPPAPPRSTPPVTGVSPSPRPVPQPRDTVRTPRDTTPAPRDSIRVRPRIPDVPTPADTATVDPEPADTLAPQAPDTTRVPHHPTPPIGPVGTPRDSVVKGPVRTLPTDTTTPPDTTTAPVDTTDTADPPDPPDPGDRGSRGRLFTVRLTWDPERNEDQTAVASLLALLRAANVPVWPQETDPADLAESRRVAALTNAADARVLGNYVVGTYGLQAEWVHIDKEEDVSQEAVDASTAFVDRLKEDGQGPGRPDGPPGRGGGAPR